MILLSVVIQEHLGFHLFRILTLFNLNRIPLFGSREHSAQMESPDNAASAFACLEEALDIPIEYSTRKISEVRCTIDSLVLRW